MGAKTASRHKSYTVHLQQQHHQQKQPSSKSFTSTSTSTAPTTTTTTAMAATYPDSATAHNRDLALQKYMLLYSQHQSLREHLDQLRPLITMTSCNTAVTSPAHSPERSPFQMTPSSAYPGTATNSFVAGRAHRRSSMPAQHVSMEGDYRRRGHGRLESIMDERAVYEMVAEERKLFNVNECMKRTLTELLNCDDARRDPDFRMWVQCRLMETERELRVERRRRSSAGMDYA